MSRGDPHAVVTGGAGFLGSHLVDELIDSGWRVTTLDNYGSGRPENLSHIQSRSLTTLDHDVRESFPQFGEVDRMYHFASRASPEDFAFHGVEIALTNSEGTRNAIECALNHDAMVILASTSEVYGNPEVHPQQEGYNGNVNPRGPRAPYDESKRFAEALAIAYARKYDVDIRTLRIFNTYGPRMRPNDGRVIPNFLSQALQNEPITVYGDGSQTRSFCYVDDLIDGIESVAGASGENAAGEVFNVGNPDELSIAELAQLVQNLVSTDSEIVHEPRPADDPEVRQPDITKIRSQFGWSPTTDLKGGLEKTIDSFKREL